MPTYVVSTQVGRLDAAMKQEIASEITRIHSHTTGAQAFFVQVIFNEIAEGNQFVGGGLLRAEHIFVHGLIRTGRNSEQKNLLLTEMVESIVNTTSIARRHVWVYISDLAPEQMIEYGYVLPNPGLESDWLDSLLPDDRQYLLGQSSQGR